LLFFCGKMAAGKSTLARELAAKENAVFMVQDDFLAALYPGQILSIADYATCSAQLWHALAPQVTAILSKGVSVVLDFPANTETQRARFRELYETAQVRHELHFLDVPDAVCKRQLADRSRHLPPGTPWTTAAEFEAITAYFQPPSPGEDFNIVYHGRQEDV
jgi:predicted kinase